MTESLNQWPRFGNCWFHSDRRISEFAVIIEPEAGGYDATGPDAIFVMFRGRPAEIVRLLAELATLERPVYCLGSDEEDQSLSLQEINPAARYIDFRKLPCYSELLAMRTNRHHFSVRRGTDWDLDLKRNSAIWLAAGMHLETVLLLDDDISSDWLSTIRAGRAALSCCAAASLVPERFPDVSCVDHAALRAGYNISPFLSGSCLFLRMDALSSPFFAPIYNEDWLFMLEQAQCGGLANIGKSGHSPYQPFVNLAKPRFQEFGEVIAEGLVWLALRMLQKIELEYAYWESIIALRAQELNEVSAELVRIGLGGGPEYCCIAAATRRLRQFSALDCVQFVHDLRKDQHRWRLMILGQKMTL